MSQEVELSQRKSMMMSFNDFFHEHNFNNKATSNIKLQQVLSSLSLVDVGIFLRDGPFESDLEMVNLHPFEGTHSVIYMNEI